MTESELQTMCEYWQKKLRLSDWIVRVYLKRGTEMALKNVDGECEWQIKTKQAAIRILDPVDYPQDAIIEQNFERILVHELLHLHFAPFDDETDTQKEIFIEQAIDCIAYGLVGIKSEMAQRMLIS